MYLKLKDQNALRKADKANIGLALRKIAEVKKTYDIHSPEGVFYGSILCGSGGVIAILAALMYRRHSPHLRTGENWRQFIHHLCTLAQDVFDFDYSYDAKRKRWTYQMYPMYIKVPVKGNIRAMVFQRYTIAQLKMEQDISDRYYHIVHGMFDIQHTGSKYIESSKQPGRYTRYIANPYYIEGKTGPGYAKKPYAKVTGYRQNPYNKATVGQPGYQKNQYFRNLKITGVRGARGTPNARLNTNSRGTNENITRNVASSTKPGNTRTQIDV